MNKILLAFSVITLLAAGCNSLNRNYSQNPVAPNPVPTTTISAPNPSPAVETYTSQNLGVSFQYLDEDSVHGFTGPTKVVEINNKIYVYVPTLDSNPQDGQYAQVFSKGSGQTLEEAITSQLLKNYPKCGFNPNPIGYGASNEWPKSYYSVSLQPKAWNNIKQLDIQNEQPYIKDCPPYIASGGVAYFLTDKNHPDQFAYFNIGQYGIAGNSVNNLWEDTFKFLK